MDPKVVVAVITAAASLLVAVASGWWSWTNAKRVHRLQAEVQRQALVQAHELDDRLAAEKAKRDYQYEARKRLYEQCEPPLFQAAELAENARYRVFSLARSAGRGDIRADGTGWLADTNYYSQSTAYLLLAPLTAAKILQRRLTSVDLGLEPRLQVQYALLKSALMTLASDFELAAMDPALPYDPDRADPDEPGHEQLLADDPARYRRQGVYLGRLDMLVEGMLDGEGVRCKSFGEFTDCWDDPGSRIGGMVPDLTGLFFGFHPATHPVLWRVLVAQFLHHELFLRAQQGDGTLPEVTMPGADVLARLDWRPPGSDVPDEEVRRPVEIGCEYLRGVVTRTHDNLIER